MTSRPLIITFSALLLSLFLASGICAQTKSRTWVKGTWEGTGYQTDDQSTWGLLFTAQGRSFSIDYPSLKCGGRWQLISVDGYRARFKERLDHGQDKCTDKGNVIIQRLNKRQVLYLYSLAGSRTVTASAVLNRKPLPKRH
jgi:hypothetical protein